MSGQNKIPDRSESGKSTIQIIVTVLVIAGLAWFAFTAVRDLLIYGFYFRYVDELAEKTGLNKYLINALAAVCLAPFVLGVKYYFFSFAGSKRTQGAALLLGMTALYNTALYVATKDDVMGKFYTITTEGVRFSDRVLGDGREWKNVNRDNIWYVTHLAVGKKVDATGRDWFDQKSGLPLLWYSKLDSQIQFYDGPGFDRFTAEPLKPVTRELYLEWKRSAQSRTPAASPVLTPAPESVTKALSSEPVLAAVAKCVPDEFDSLEKVEAAGRLYREKGLLPWQETMSCWGIKMTETEVTLAVIKASNEEFGGIIKIPTTLGYRVFWDSPQQYKVMVNEDARHVLGRSEAVKGTVESVRFKGVGGPATIRIWLVKH